MAIRGVALPGPGAARAQPANNTRSRILLAGVMLLGLGFSFYAGRHFSHTQAQVAAAPQSVLMSTLHEETRVNAACPACECPAPKAVECPVVPPAQECPPPPECPAAPECPAVVVPPAPTPAAAAGTVSDADIASFDLVAYYAAHTETPRAPFAYNTVYDGVPQAYPVFQHPLQTGCNPNSGVGSIHFKSQYGEDRVAGRYFPNKRCGVFMEMGALDGMQFSNSYHFEKDAAWGGILLEASPPNFKKLVGNRCSPTSIVCILRAAASEPGTLEFVGQGPQAAGADSSEHYDTAIRKHIGGKTKVASEPMSTILKRAGVKHIDFYSLDVEGAEIHTLSSLDFYDTPVRLFVIESNRDIVAGPEHDWAAILKAHGYQRDETVTNEPSNTDDGHKRGGRLYNKNFRLNEYWLNPNYDLQVAERLLLGRVRTPMGTTTP